MITRQQILFSIIFVHLSLAATAQNTGVSKPELAVEVRVTTYLQSGYDLGLFYYPKNSRFSIGALVAGHDVRGTTKEWLFDSDAYDDLTIRLAWLASLQIRYHMAEHREGFFGELGIGMEEFRVTAGEATQANANGFIAPAIGYIWYPWQRNGFYLMPKVNGVCTLFREDKRMLDETSYQLRPFFVTPSLAIGWKF